MSRTVAVPLEELAAADPFSLTGQPLCPSCKVGYLHPYEVHIHLGTAGAARFGAVGLVGWSAVCVGNGHYLSAKYAVLVAEGETEVPALVESMPCGFAMPMAPHASGKLKMAAE